LTHALIPHIYVVQLKMHMCCVSQSS
jgi:hypothetical protein